MIELKTVIPLPPETVWDYLTGDAHVENWWGEGVTLEPFQKGRFIENWTDAAGRGRVTTGMITAFEPPARLQFDFRRDDWERATRVEFLLSPDGKGTKVELQHSGWDVIADEAARKKEVDAHAERWAEILKNFSAYCARR